MSANTYPIELESRHIDCRSEQDRTMLREAHNICCDARRSEDYSPERLRAISSTCLEYGLGKTGEFVAALAERLQMRAA